MLLKNLLYGRTYCAVEHTSINNEECFNVLLLSLKKNTFEIIHSEVYQNFNDVITNIPKHQHVFVIFNNKHVLSKKIEGVDDLNKTVASAFPNISKKDFYIECSHQKTHSFVSICRTKDVDRILNNYKEHHLNVIGYSLGNVSISTVIPYLKQEQVQTSNSLIHIKDDCLISIDKSIELEKQNYDLNGLTISSNHLLPFSGILTHYSNSNATTSNFNDSINDLKENFKQKRVFSNGLKFGLGFILIGLLINFLVFSHYRDQVALLSNSQLLNQNNKQSFLKLEQELVRKRNFVSDITTKATSKVSFFMDEIGQSIPSSILLSQINYQPLEKSIKKEKEIIVTSNSIIISGESNLSEEFSTWIEQLEKLHWVSKLTVLDYGIGSKSKTAFSIQIKFNL